MAKHLKVVEDAPFPISGTIQSAQFSQAPDQQAWNPPFESRFLMLERNLSNLTAAVAELTAMNGAILSRLLDGPASSPGADARVATPQHWLPLAIEATVKLKEVYGDALVAVVPRTKTEEGQPLLMLVAQVRMPSEEARQIRDKLYSEWWDGVDEQLKDDVILGIEHAR